MSGPGPAANEIDALLTIASRVPDHGKLTPWRFVLFEGDARLKAGEIIASAFKGKYPTPPRSSLRSSGRALHARRWSSRW